MVEIFQAIEIKHIPVNIISHVFKTYITAGAQDDPMGWNATASIYMAGE